MFSSSRKRTYQARRLNSCNVPTGDVASVLFTAMSSFGIISTEAFDAYQ